MRTFGAILLALASLAFGCQSQPSEAEKQLLAELQTLKAERASRDYLGELKDAVETWRKAMNAALAKYNDELSATRLESQQQVTTMAESLDRMQRALTAQMASQDSYLAEVEKDRVQTRKTLEEIKIEREAVRVERDAVKLERDKVTALQEAIHRERVQDAEARKELATRLTGLARTSADKFDLLLGVVDRYRTDLQGLDRGIASIQEKQADLAAAVAADAGKDEVLAGIDALGKKLGAEQARLSEALAQGQQAAEKAREQGRQQGLDLGGRIDALASVTEERFTRLDKKLDEAEKARAAEAAARRRAAKGASEGAATKHALPGKQDRDPESLLSEPQPFWENPFIAIPSGFLLLVMLFFLLKRSPEESTMDLREAPERGEQEALERDSDPHPEPAPRTVGHPAPAAASHEELRMPTPATSAGARVVDRPGRNDSQSGLPRPRCLSLRIPGEELGEGAEELLQERLARDPRILVEPRPRLERRGDGSLSARFYSVGGLAETEVEALSRSLRSLVANR